LFVRVLQSGLKFFPTALTLAATTMLPAQDRTVFVGTYTNGASKGIYTFRFNTTTGKTKESSLAAESSNPAFLAVHPNGRFLYAANENPIGMVSAFSIASLGDAGSGRLAFLIPLPLAGRARPQGCVPAGGQPGLRHGGGLPDRSEYRGPDTVRERRADPLAGIPCFRFTLAPQVRASFRR
jgi:hypothetical protein